MRNVDEGTPKYYTKKDTSKSLQCTRIIDVPQMWQGIKWSVPSALLRRLCDSRGWPWMSWTLTVAFLAHVVSYA